MKAVTVAKKSDSATVQENNGRVLSLCDLQGSLRSKTRANLLMLFLMLAGTATEHRAGGSVSRILCNKPFCTG